MPKARQLEIADFDFPAMDLASMKCHRLRIRGRVADKGHAVSDSECDVWLHVRTSYVTIRVTASPSSPLSKASIASEVDLACTLTGMVDLTQGVYFAEKAQLLRLRDPAAQA